VEDITVRQLIGIAWGILDSQISGGPGWIGSDHFDISAKAESNVNFEEMRPMLQSLLADRFRLVVQRKPEELPVYALVDCEGRHQVAAIEAGELCYATGRHRACGREASYP
jgi:uncharacterized protein (TIGR03435 family)